MRVLARVEGALLNQRGHLFPWSPVCLAIGIGLYFAVRFEPDLTIFAGLSCLGLLTAWAGRRMHPAWRPLAFGGALVAAGFVLAGARAHLVAEPVLQWRYYGPVEGRVVALDRSASDALRITLDQARIGDIPPDQSPQRIRLSLHGDHVPLAPGQRVMTTANLSPPQGPVEPGGFDFRRHAWFQGLGAVGYTRVPVLTTVPARLESGVRVTAWRMAISRRVQEVLPGEAGGFAAAVTTGDRSGMSQTALDKLRASNLAHLLAISGLHMGLLTGFVFMACRVLLSAIPALALKLPVKKLAAVFALFSAVLYLLLSGGNVATERAFVMVAVMFVAVLIDRRAISLRAVAVAALIVLILRPESLLSPGFQMSFAATTALVSVFGALRNVQFNIIPKLMRPIGGLLGSSAVAGLATAPIGAAHFNMVSYYGLLANALSVPVMGAVVVPAAVLAAILAPFGLEALAIHMMGVGLAWILAVSDWVSAFEGARGFIVSPPHFVLPVFAMGSLWVILWNGRVRWLGVIPALVAISMWGQGHRPEVLIADTGGLVGVMTDQGRALSKEKGAGFIASVWLENDGDQADQLQAAKRWPNSADKIRRYSLKNKELIHITGKRAASTMTTCQTNQMVVSAVPVVLSGDCTVFDPKILRETGSISFANGKMQTVTGVTGRRLWSKRGAEVGKIQ